MEMYLKYLKFILQATVRKHFEDFLNKRTWSLKVLEAVSSGGQLTAWVVRHKMDKFKLVCFVTQHRPLIASYMPPLDTAGGGGGRTPEILASGTL